MKRKKFSDTNKAPARKKKKSSFECSECDHAPFSASFVLHEHMLNEHRICCDCNYAVPEEKFNDHEAVYEFARHLACEHNRDAVYCLKSLVGAKPTLTFRVRVAKDNAHALSKRNHVVIDEREFHVHKDQELQCLECNKFFDESYYDEHIMRMHKACPWCKDQVELASIKTLHEHVQNEHPDIKIYECDKCDEYISVDEKLASNHHRQCSGKEIKNHKYQCNIAGCERSFSRPDSAGHHAVSAHYVCPVCNDFEIDSEKPLGEEVERLASHICTKHDRVVYLCQEVDSNGAKCVTIGTNKKTAQEHAKTHNSHHPVEAYQPMEIELTTAPSVLRSPTRGNDNKFACNREKCEKSFSKKETCLNHLITEHQACPSCDFELDDSNNLKSLAHHLSTAHPGKYSTVYWCPNETCNFLALDKNRASSHNKKHPKQKPIERYNASTQSTAVIDLRPAQAAGDAPFNVPVWCWFKKWSAKTSQENKVTLQNCHCNQELLTKNDAIEHFQSVHNVCFTCLEKKALFKTTQSLLSHITKKHQSENKLKGKCPAYNDKKVCTHCCNQCQYESEDGLMAHLHEKHSR